MYLINGCALARARYKVKYLRASDVLVIPTGFLTEGVSPDRLRVPSGDSSTVWMGRRPNSRPSLKFATNV